MTSARDETTGVQSPAPPRQATLFRDAAVTIATRIGLAVLIFGTDIVLARLLGPAAKGRFALVLLYSQLVALVLGWGMDQALAVVSARDRPTAGRGIANALIWSAVVGGIGVLVSAWAYGLGHPGPPDGPLVPFLENLSARQFVYAALAIPGELFFAVGLFALLGQRMVAAYSGIRILRRLVLLILVVAAAAIARLSLETALVLNLVALAITTVGILAAAQLGDFLSLRPSLALLREQLRFGTRAMPGSLAERLQFRIDTFFVNAFSGVRATGIYSVTSGLAETLWYVPNALGIVMFSRAVDPGSDAGRVAAVLTRTTIATALATAVPTFLLGPYVVRAVYGATFADAGVALRFLLPGIVAYSVVAVLTRYITGHGKPGTTTMIMAIGVVANIVGNAVLTPRYGINGAAAASSISYALTAAMTLVVFLRLSGRGVAETLILRPSDVAAARRAVGAIRRAIAERGRAEPVEAELADDTTAALIIAEHEPGEER